MLLKDTLKLTSSNFFLNRLNYINRIIPTANTLSKIHRLPIELIFFQELDSMQSFPLILFFGSILLLE